VKYIIVTSFSRPRKPGFAAPHERVRGGGARRPAQGTRAALQRNRPSLDRPRAAYQSAGRTFKKVDHGGARHQHTRGINFWAPSGREETDRRLCEDKGAWPTIETVRPLRKATRARCTSVCGNAKSGDMVTPICDKCRRRKIVSFKVEPEEAWRIVVLNRWKSICPCRHCLRVRYRSQCGDARDRAHLAIAKIEKRLITRRGRFYKPKGMLWRTFHRLCDRYDHHDAVLKRRAPTSRRTAYGPKGKIAAVRGLQGFTTASPTARS